MDWSIFLDYALKIVGSLTASLIVTFASILFAKLQGKIKDSKLTAYIKECVKAAEQLYPNTGMKMGTKKYKYVVQQVLAKFPSVVENDYLKSLIEGAVFALNKQLYLVEDIKQNDKIDDEKQDNKNGNTLNSF